MRHTLRPRLQVSQEVNSYGRFPTAEREVTDAMYSCCVRCRYARTLAEAKPHEVINQCHVSRPREEDILKGDRARWCSGGVSSPEWELVGRLDVEGPAEQTRRSMVTKALPHLGSP